MHFFKTRRKKILLSTFSLSCTNTAYYQPFICGIPKAEHHVTNTLWSLNSETYLKLISATRDVSQNIFSYRGVNTSCILVTKKELSGSKRLQFRYRVVILELSMQMTCWIILRTNSLNCLKKKKKINFFSNFLTVNLQKGIPITLAIKPSLEICYSTKLRCLKYADMYKPEK